MLFRSIEEYNKLYDRINVQEEQYALQEARFNASEAHQEHMNDYHNPTLMEAAKRARDWSAKLQLESTRRNLRLKRLWLDIGYVKRELGSWDAWWYDFQTV